MRAMKTVFAVLIAASAMSVYAVEGAPPLDAVKYPQDTPQNAVMSIVKALEGKDFVYWIANLIIPEDSARISEKHGGLEKAAALNGDPKYTERRAKMLETMKALATTKVTDVEKDGKKIARFIGVGHVIQFEQQGDKRWCMNIRVTTEQNMDNPGAGKAKAGETPKAGEAPKAEAPKTGDGK